MSKDTGGMWPSHPGCWNHCQRVTGTEGKEEQSLPVDTKVKRAACRQEVFSCQEGAEIEQPLKELLYTYHTDEKVTKEKRGMSVHMNLDISGVSVESTEEKKKKANDVEKRKNKTGQRSE